MIRPVQPSDAEAICLIYNEYIKETTVTFEETPVSLNAMGLRIEKITRDYPWLVLEKGGEVIGYSYALRWKERSAYRYAVEVAIYIHREHTGEGAGTRLLQALLSQLEAMRIHSVIAGITLPNPASVALFEKLGFEKAAQFHEVGFKMDEWRDVGYWELLLP